MAVVVSTVDTMDIQVKVDKYLELHEEMSALRKEMDTLKKSIRTHMDKEGVESIKGTYGKQVYLQDAKASNSTSRYTDYELNDLLPILGNDIKKVTEIRVNADKVEGLAKLSAPELKHKILATKIVKVGTPRFSVKK